MMKTVRWITLVVVLPLVLALPASAQTNSAGHYAPPLPIILYDAGVATGGNLGGRAGADNICQTSANRPAGYTDFRAFISVDANDEVRDMPDNYGVQTDVPIQSLGGTGIANNWADLLNASIPTTLENAGVTSDFWWSGSQDDGSLKTDINCLNWTDGTFQKAGWAGFWNETDLAWIDGQAMDCRYPGRLLCLGMGSSVAPVGGYVAPINRLELLAPWLGLAALAGLVLARSAAPGSEQKPRSSPLSGRLSSAASRSR